MWWLLALPALAQDPETEPAPTSDEPAVSTDPDEAEEIEAEEVDAEMIVYGRLAIDRASDAIIKKMEGLGYEARQKGDRIVFRPPLGWMGAAIFEDGIMSFRRSVMGASPPDDSVNTQLIRTIDPEVSGTTGYGLRFWVLPSMKKVEPVRAALLEAIGPELSRYNAVVARTALQERLADLPDRLDAVWNSGTPLVGTATLSTPADRRHHVLDYWASRGSTPEGRLTARAVSDWLEAVVQASAHPITEDERKEYERRRGDGLTLP
ncbi:MAG: hypothetical protein AAGA48_34260 [Myxococcota bacterium]